VIIQATRGRLDSDGDFVPLARERDDGQDTLSWVAEQPWCDGRIGMFGGSYMGYTQWAAAAGAPGVLKAIVPHITSTHGRDWVYPGGAFAFDARLRWAGTIHMLDHGQALRDAERERRYAAAFRHLPVIEADAIAFGRPTPFYRDWLSHPPDSPFWQAHDQSNALAAAPPAHLIGGWYDYMLHGQLQDYAALRAAGQTPYLTIGPWTHGSIGSMATGMRESLTWLNAHLKDQRADLRTKPVHIFVMNAGWRDFDHWPPPAQTQRLYLCNNGVLGDLPAETSTPDHFRYDPADPTPMIGGPLLSPPNGPQDQRPLEARRDILVYTSPPLTATMPVIGPVRLELFAHSSLAYTDFVGRLCVVKRNGSSINLCDGLVRVSPGSCEELAGIWRIVIDMWATAYRFQAGEQIRLHLASGAHPRWSRNLGRGGPIGTETAMQSAEQTIYHDRAHPSALVLPCVS